MAKKSVAIDVEMPAVEVHGKTLFDRVSDFLIEKDWNFYVVEEGKCQSFGLRLRDAGVRVYVDTVEGEAWSRILVYCVLPTYVPAPRRQHVADAMARVNFTSVFGNLEMDMKDGEVRIRTVLEGEHDIGRAMIDRAIFKSIDLADQYQAPLLAIAFGNASPGDVLALASRAEDATLQ
jgi:hypothetical protein